MLSVDGGIILISFVISNLSIFMLCFFEVPRDLLKKLDYFKSIFFWQSDEHKKKYRSITWSIVYSPKEQGGLGILNSTFAKQVPS